MRSGAKLSLSASSLSPRNDSTISRYIQPAEPVYHVHPSQEFSPVGELGIVRVQSEKHPAHGVNFGDHMPIFFLPLLNIYVIK